MDDAGQENFYLPIWKAGVGFDFILDQDNVLGLTTEFNKFVGPTHQDYN